MKYLNVGTRSLISLGEGCQLDFFGGIKNPSLFCVPSSVLVSANQRSTGFSVASFHHQCNLAMCELKRKFGRGQRVPLSRPLRFFVELE